MKANADIVAFLLFACAVLTACDMRVKVDLDEGAAGASTAI